MNLFQALTPSGSFTDSNPVELGVKFLADTAGEISQILFYKAFTETGTHEGHLWAADGTLIADFRFSGESAGGWQVATLSAPVLIAANTTYIASYHSNGSYVATPGGFSSAVTNGDLTAPASADTGGNGVYTYGATAFPASPSTANYFVDVSFTPYSGSNFAPVITGGATASYSVAENTTAVASVGAMDSNGDSVTFAIAGGADSARFQIDATTGALSFIAPPNFEAPADADGDNVYEVDVQAFDATHGSYIQRMAVSVSNVTVENAAPTDLSFGSLLGHQLTLDYRFGDANTVLTGENLDPRSFTAGPGVDVVGWGPGTIGGPDVTLNVDVDGATLLFDYDGTFTGPWGASWSGPHLFDQAGTLPDITGVSIVDESGLSPAIPAGAVAFDANNIWVNWASTSYNLASDTHLKLAVTFAGNSNSIAENTPVGSGIKVAELSFADDGNGTNTVSVSDPTDFEVRTNAASGALELYYIGASPDYETQNVYTTQVIVDDPAINGTTAELTQTFTLNITDVANENPDIAPLLSGDYWTGIERMATPVFVTYSFPTTSSAAASDVMGAAAGTFQAFNAAQQAAARAAINQWANASGITAIEVAPGMGDINFRLYDFTNSAYAGVGGIGFNPFGDWNFLTMQAGGTEATYFTDQGDGITTASGDVFINSALLADGEIPAGLLLHEIGHALGLKHPVASQPDNVVYSGLALHDATYAAGSAEDDTSRTVMSYSGASPTALGDLDVAAIQAIYGTNAQDGSQVGSWSFDSATQTLTQTGHAGSDNIMLGVSVNDVMTGGNGSDQLFGYAGNDALDGGAGDDRLWGGRGNDTMTGGTGADIFYATLFDGTAAQADVVTDFTSGEDVIDVTLFSGGSFMGPASFEVLFNHLLRDDGAGNAQLIGIWNSYLQTVTLSGTSPGALTASDVVLDTSGVARSLTGSGGNDQLLGGLGDDTLYGGDGADFFAGDAGNDEMHGEAGTDRFDGGAGADTFDGGAGLDRVDYNVATTLILDASGVAQAGSSAEALGDTFIGIEQIRGSALGDYIDGSTAVGILWGFGGNDTLIGSAGSNEIVGGTGDDIIHGGGADGTPIAGDTGNVRTDEVLYGGDGNDTIFVETLAGQKRAFAWGDAGNDTIVGGAGDDELFGGDGADSITGGAGLNNINGGAGDDIIHGGGASGTAAGRNEVLYGGDGNDTIFVETLAGQVAYAWGDGGNDTITGGAGNDSLFGGDGADVISGGGGTNRYYDYDGAQSGDVYKGGAGRDDILYSGYAAGATLDFSAAGADGWDDAIEAVQFLNAATVIGTSGIDRFHGSGNNADTFYGQAGNDWLIGWGGNDFLSGGADNDRLDGGLGSDTLIGGAGSDVLNGGDPGNFNGDGAADLFEFALTDMGTYDVIRDFEVGLDRIGLVGTGLTTGAFNASRFFASGQTITGTAPALIYDQANGVLSYDADGAGAGAALGVTLVKAGTALTASSIVVV